MRKIGSFGLLTICLLLSSFAFVYAEDGTTSGSTSSLNPVSAVVTLPLYRTYTGCGYVVASIGVRNTGRGTISVRLPAGSTIVDAWLYWITLDSDPQLGANSIITVSGNRVVGALIGKGPDPCWGPTAVTTGFTYRARVNDQLIASGTTSGGEYGVTIGGMATYMIAGLDPWDSIPSVDANRPLPENVALVVVYRLGTVPASAVLRLYNGYFMQSGGAATFTYAWPARTVGGARFSHVTADGQVSGGTYTKNVNFGGTVIDTNVLTGIDPSIRTKATITGSLSDTNTYHVGALVPMAGGARTITWNCGSDCISWSVLLFWSGTESFP